MVELEGIMVLAGPVEAHHPLWRGLDPWSNTFTKVLYQIDRAWEKKVKQWEVQSLQSR